MARIDWNKILPHIVEVASNYRRRAGSAPTLRGLYYALVSDETIPNTKSAYKGLSRALTDARKSGAFPWSYIRDETRPVTDGGDRYRDTLSEHLKKCDDIQDSYVNTVKYALERILEARVKTTIKKWENQQNRVMILVEKEAIADAVNNFAAGWNIDIMVMRGYASATSMKELGDRLSAYDDDLDIKVLMLTDFDPSGEDIARYAEECLTNDFGIDAEFIKIGVNMDQIEQYNLPSTPETAEERAKMSRDPRFQNWEHGFFRVEVDALLAIVPEEFKQIINDAISQFYDYVIEADVIEQASEVTQRARELLEELRPMIEPLYIQLNEAFDLE